MTGADLVLLAALSTAAPQSGAILNAKAAIAVAIKTCLEKLPQLLTDTNPENWGYVHMQKGWLLSNRTDDIRAFVPYDGSGRPDCVPKGPPPPMRQPRL